MRRRAERGVEAIVLAGGLGMRLRAVVSGLPKPMAPVAGRPFLEHLLEYWIGQGVRRFILSVGYKAESVMARFGERYGGAAIDYATEPSPLGTGGGLLLALARAGSAQILVLNGDTFFAVPLAELAAFHAARGADCSIALFRSEDAERYLGVRRGAHARILALGHKPRGEGALANGGVYLLRAAALRAAPWQAGDRLSLEADLLPWGLANGWRLYGARFDRAFIDIGIPEDYRRAAALMRPWTAVPRRRRA